MDPQRSANKDSSGQDARWAEHVQTLAASFAYPVTPDLAAGLRARGRRMEPAVQRRLRWAAIALGLLIVIGSLLAVPQVRAAVLEVLRIGAVRILPAPPSSQPTLTPAASAAPGTGPGISTTPTGAATPTPIASVLDLAGETTLGAAQQELGFTLQLPAYPPNLGPPSHVFVQHLVGPVAILVWTDPARPDKVRLSLYEVSAGAFLEKMAPRTIQETEVNGGRAVWAEGPYLLVARDGSADMRRLVEGPVLIWTASDITYRLETDTSLDEARRTAESLRPAPGAGRP